LYFEVDRADQWDISDAEKEILEPVWMTADEFFAKSRNDTTIYCLNHLLGRQQEQRPTTDRVLS
jgi:hypothetical protein